MQVVPVILSGGSGTRLWPLSRARHPKQLLEVVEGASMLQATVMRLQALADLVDISRAPVVVCNEEYRFISAEQLVESGYATRDIVLEPVGRNTAPALTLAALLLLGRQDDALLLAMPADHFVADREAFAQAVLAGVPAALAGDIVTFGVRPSHPQTGYGYMQVDAAMDLVPCPVAAFVEKPNAQTAERYLADGRYLWNGGIFLLKASVWRRAIGMFSPEILGACEDAVRRSTRDVDFVRVNAQAFAACPSDSIDYAVMEKLPASPDCGVGIKAVPMDAGWCDVGAWDALWGISAKDADDNVLRGDVVVEETRSTMVIASDRLVACIGVEDLVVVETTDAVLVAHKNATQAVKGIVQRLKREGRPEAEAHRKVHRPWGYDDAIDAGERFQVKRIVVKPGGTLSLQMHHHRAEHWIVVRGTARVTRGDECVLLTENQTTYIPVGVSHRLENPGKLLLEIIEVQSGSYLGEDDIVRLADYYGRG